MISGRVVRLGDDVNTDVIIPGPYLNLTDPKALGSHLLEGYDPALSARLQPDDILVAGTNFGAGSSREQAPVAILGRGIPAVIAAGFARIFLRNAINLGLPAIESPEAAAALLDGERVDIDLAAGRITGERSGTFEVPGDPAFVTEILRRGGLIPWVRARLESRREAHGSAPDSAEGGAP